MSSGWGGGMIPYPLYHRMLSGSGLEQAWQLSCQVTLGRKPSITLHSSSGACRVSILSSLMFPGLGGSEIQIFHLWLVFSISSQHSDQLWLSEVTNCKTKQLWGTLGSALVDVSKQNCLEGNLADNSSSFPIRAYGILNHGLLAVLFMVLGVLSLWAAGLMSNQKVTTNLPLMHQWSSLAWLVSRVHSCCCCCFLFFFFNFIYLNNIFPHIPDHWW